MPKIPAPRKPAAPRRRASAGVPAAPSNRRREWRLSLPLSMVVRGKAAKTGAFEERTRLENISSTGAFFRLASPVALGDRVRMLIDLPAKLTDGRPLRLSLGGVAVRLERPGNGGKSGVAVNFSKSFKFLEAPRA